MSPWKYRRSKGRQSATSGNGFTTPNWAATGSLPARAVRTSARESNWQTSCQWRPNQSKKPLPAQAALDDLELAIVYGMSIGLLHAAPPTKQLQVLSNGIPAAIIARFKTRE